MLTPAQMDKDLDYLELLYPGSVLSLLGNGVVFFA